MSGAVFAKKLQDEKVYRGSGLNTLMGIGVTPLSLQAQGTGPLSLALSPPATLGSDFRSRR